MSSNVPSPGALVAWWDGGDLEIGVVGADEKGRVRLVRPGGHELRVPGSRLAFAVESPGRVPDGTLEGRRAAGERAAAMAERTRVLARSCEVALIWEIVSDRPEAHTAGDLSELAFGNRNGPERAAMIRALLDDGIHFTRKGDGWEPRPAAQVRELTLQRQRAAERAEEERTFFAAVVAAVGGEGFRRGGSVPEKRYLGALRDLAIGDQAAPAGARRLALRALEESGLRHDRPDEGAFRLLRVLGEFERDDENLAVLRHGLREEFPPEVVSHAADAVRRGFDATARADLTGLEIVTIDSPGTREIDDGISVEPLAGGRVRLGVHVADPAAFVLPGDPVDREAFARGITHYLPDRKLLMVPDCLSEEAASLAPDSERPALSFLTVLDERGEIVEFEVLRSVIRSRARLTYEEVDRSVEQDSGPFAGLLSRLVAVSMLRERRRMEDGAIRIPAPEVEVRLDRDGQVRLERRPAGSASQQCVGEAMVLAGSVAARFCVERGVPGIFRRQPAPDRPLALPEDGRWDPVAIRAARLSLRRGEVGLQPGRHHALGLDAYAQATSPLRRYQDLATHRQITAVLERGTPEYDAPALQRIAASTEQAESVSRRVERSANQYWLLRYLEQREVRTVRAVVVALEPRPVVQLEETLIERPLPSLRGVELGQRIELRVDRVNPRADLIVLRA